MTLKTFVISFLILLSFAHYSWANELTWEASMPVPIDGFQNPYALNEQELKASIQRGRVYALEYPVTVTGLLIPYEPVKNFMDHPADSFLRRRVQKVFQNISHMKSLDDLFDWLGLHTYPNAQESNPVYHIPYPNGQKPEYRMGFTLQQTPQGVGFTISCAVCHSHNLFGKRVLGLTNRFSRANEFFIMGKKALAVSPAPLFKWTTGATKQEKKMFKRSKQNIKFVKAKKPEALGMDTSLAHVALSLARRSQDPYATKDYENLQYPRYERLKKFPADSKPGVWWNVKYKNKWLLDGSVVSGNPIFTNLLWNEIGRGTDLKELEMWLNQNQQVVADLTNAVFHNEAPRFTDFFDESHFDLKKVKKGEQVYQQLCSKCHGDYIKAWSQGGAHELSLKEQLKTIQVALPEQTPVKDVGTDPHRYQGMQSLLQLNDLAISKNNEIQIQLQKGYVPPPLVGIWARWPYLHNNSIPSLCALLTPSAQRPQQYWSGEAIDPKKDFDKECNGYPLGEQTPLAWKKDPEHHYDTSRQGMGAMGHDDRIFIKKGQNVLSTEDRKNLIMFLQTL